MIASISGNHFTKPDGGVPDLNISASFFQSFLNLKSWRENVWPSVCVLLESLHSIPSNLGLSPSSTPSPSFLLMQTLGSSLCGLVLAPGSWLGSGPAPAIVEWNSRWELFLSLSSCLLKIKVWNQITVTRRTSPYLYMGVESDCPVKYRLKSYY